MDRPQIDPQVLDQMDEDEELVKEALDYPDAPQMGRPRIDIRQIQCTVCGSQFYDETPQIGDLRLKLFPCCPNYLYHPILVEARSKRAVEEHPIKD